MVSTHPALFCSPIKAGDSMKLNGSFLRKPSKMKRGASIIGTKLSVMRKAVSYVRNCWESGSSQPGCCGSAD